MTVRAGRSFLYQFFLLLRTWQSIHFCPLWLVQNRANKLCLWGSGGGGWHQKEHRWSVFRNKGRKETDALLLVTHLLGCHSSSFYLSSEWRIKGGGCLEVEISSDTKYRTILVTKWIIIIIILCWTGCTSLSHLYINLYIYIYICHYYCFGVKTYS